MARCCIYKANWDGMIGKACISLFSSAHFLRLKKAIVYFVVLSALDLMTVSFSLSTNDFKAGSSIAMSSLHDSVASISTG